MSEFNLTIMDLVVGERYQRELCSSIIEHKAHHSWKQSDRFKHIPKEKWLYAYSFSDGLGIKFFISDTMINGVRVPEYDLVFKGGE